MKISVQNLSVGYDGIPVQKDLTFGIEAGDVFLILGGSGCGKSTLLRHLTGLEWPIAGSIDVEGVGAPTSATGRPPFGVLFQSGALFGSMTLAQNVSLPLRSWT